jgi:hypothetical protein
MAVMLVATAVGEFTSEEELHAPANAIAATINDRFNERRINDGDEVCIVRSSAE